MSSSEVSPGMWAEPVDRWMEGSQCLLQTSEKLHHRTGPGIERVGPDLPLERSVVEREPLRRRRPRRALPDLLERRSA